MKKIFAALVAIVTASAFAETYYMVGNDVNGQNAIAGKRADAWNTEQDGSGTKTQVPSAGNNYIITGTHAFNSYTGAINFEGDLLTFGTSLNDDYTQSSPTPPTLPPSGYTWIIPNMIVGGKVKYQHANAGSYTGTFGGDSWRIDGAFTISLNKAQSLNYTFSPNLSGAGDFAFLLPNAYGGKTTPLGYQVVTFSGDHSNFKGKVTLTGGASNNGSGNHKQNLYNVSYLKFPTGSKFFGDPEVLTEDSIVVTLMTLWFEDDVTTGPNRGWKFSSSRVSNYNYTPMIYVAEGKTVTIKGPVNLECTSASNTRALIKYGAGDLVFENWGDDQESFNAKIDLQGGRVLYQSAGDKFMIGVDPSDAPSDLLMDPAVGYFNGPEEGVSYPLTAQAEYVYAGGMKKLVATGYNFNYDGADHEGAGTIVDGVCSQDVTYVSSMNGGTFTWQYKTQHKLSLAVNDQAMGTIEGAVDGQFVDEGGSVTLTAVPATDFDADVTFDHWDGDVEGIDVNAVTVEVTVNAARSLTAVFVGTVHHVYYKNGADGNYQCALWGTRNNGWKPRFNDQLSKNVLAADDYGVIDDNTTINSMNEDLEFVGGKLFVSTNATGASWTIGWYNVKIPQLIVDGKFNVSAGAPGEASLAVEKTYAGIWTVNGELALNSAVYSASGKMLTLGATLAGDGVFK